MFHRLSYPFPLVVIDRLVEVERRKSIRTVKWVTADEFILAGHFPGEPTMPGVLTLEGIIQSALILVDASHDRGRLSGSLEKVERIRFKRAIVPGDRVDFLVSLIAMEGDFWKFKGKAQVGGETAADADVTLKVINREVGFDL